jgi:succinate dehydrogenase hydrophobic anchor subunit
MHGLASFLAEALAGLRQPGVGLAALAMLLLLTGSNILLLRNMPEPGDLPSAAAIFAIVLRIGGLAYVGTALIRALAGSERPQWRPDGAFWLYLLATLASLAVGAGLASLLCDSREALPVLVRGVVSAVVLAPFAPWLVGMAAARPLGINPRRFMRQFGRWFPHLIFWSLLVVTPLGVAHALIDFQLIEGVGDLFWPLALFDGALSLLIILFGFALNVAAYRRVAPG